MCENCNCEEKCTDCKCEQENVIDEQKILRNAMITTASKMVAYFYDNKDNISKTDLFKVFLESTIRNFDIPFPDNYKKFLFKEETASDIMKNILALQIHMVDILYNKMSREIMNSWKKEYLSEIAPEVKDETPNG